MTIAGSVPSLPTVRSTKTYTVLSENFYNLYNTCLSSEGITRRLRTYIEALPDRKLTADHNRELQNELAEMQRNKATPEQQAEYIAQARKTLFRY